MKCTCGHIEGAHNGPSRACDRCECMYFEAEVTKMSDIIDKLKNFEGDLIATLKAVMDQTESDLASAHAEICKLQGLDPATNTWPDWSPQANTLKWLGEIRRRYGLT